MHNTVQSPNDDHMAQVDSVKVVEEDMDHKINLLSMIALDGEEDHLEDLEDQEEDMDLDLDLDQDQEEDMDQDLEEDLHREVLVDHHLVQTEIHLIIIRTVFEIITITMME